VVCSSESEAMKGVSVNSKESPKAESVLRADNLVSCVVIPNELRLELRV
jgi:hypothetical protein